MIINKNNENFGFKRIDFINPFEPYVFGDDVYEGELLYEKLLYNKKEDIYLYEDDFIQVYSPTEPISKSSLFAKIKPIPYKSILNFDIYTSNLDFVKNKEYELLCFKIINTKDEKIYEGYLVTQLHLNSIFKKSKLDDDFFYRWFYRLHKDIYPQFIKEKYIKSKDDLGLFLGNSINSSKDIILYNRMRNIDIDKVFNYLIDQIIKLESPWIKKFIK